MFFRVIYRRSGGYSSWLRHVTDRDGSRRPRNKSETKASLSERCWRTVLEHAGRGYGNRQSASKNLFSTVRFKVRRERFPSLLHPSGARSADSANGRRSGHHRADFHRQWREHALSSRRLRENHSEWRLGWCRGTLPRDRDDGATPADGNQSVGDRASTLGFIFGLYTISR